MKYFITADLHLNHNKILDYCNRPFSDLKDMNCQLIKNWNKKVKEEDTVFHVGDFCFGDHEFFTSELNGQIIFIKGNHDDVKLTRIDNLHFTYGGITMFMAHDPAHAFISPTRHIICGHIHNLFKETKSPQKHVINAGTDVWNFTPVKIDTIIKMFNKKC